MSIDSLPDNIDRIDIDSFSQQEFIDKYERTYMPVIIQNCQKEWLAQEKWTLDVNTTKLFDHNFLLYILLYELFSTLLEIAKEIPQQVLQGGRGRRGLLGEAQDEVLPRVH
jgi:hypothetical protein